MADWTETVVTMATHLCLKRACFYLKQVRLTLPCPPLIIWLLVGRSTWYLCDVTLPVRKNWRSLVCDAQALAQVRHNES